MSMQFHFIGTGAADWGGFTNLRGYTCTMLDGHILFDAGPTVIEEMQRQGLDVSAVTDLLITHSHPDHFQPDQIAVICRSATVPVRIYGTPQALARLEDVNCVKIPLTFGQRFQTGKYDITVLPSNHTVSDIHEETFHYLVEAEGKAALYALDGGWFRGPARILLNGKKLDLIIWDATCGACLDDWRFAEHNDLAMIRSMRTALAKHGIVTESTRHIFDHISRCLWKMPENDGFATAAEYDGILAFDGMIYELS